MATHVFTSMGTVVSLTAPTGIPSADDLTAVECAFSHRDERFSLYRPSSEASLVANGSRTLQRSSEAMREAYGAAMAWYSRTGGVFTPHRPDGVIDLAGTVKADAVAEAGRVLHAAGIHDWMINAGGDILWSGSHGERPWQVGVVDPLERGQLLCSLAVPAGRGALATSGTAERGDHVWRARTPDSGVFRQVSVLAEDITTADVLATTILAGGEEIMDDALDRFSVDVLCVDMEGGILASGAFRRARGVRPL